MSCCFYSYICIGELAAVVAAACLTLEYGISGAAVARSWGDKVLLWLEQGAGWTSAPAWLVPGGIQLPAMAVSAASTAILYAGVNESKHVTSGITALKMVIVVFMIVGGFCLFEPKNMQPPLMPFGLKGVCRGATVSFFGYLGYDEVCAVAGEGKWTLTNQRMAVALYYRHHPSSPFLIHNCFQSLASSA